MSVEYICSDFFVSLDLCWCHLHLSSKSRTLSLSWLVFSFTFSPQSVTYWYYFSEILFVTDCMFYNIQSSTVYSFSLLMGLSFELGASCLLRWRSTTWATRPALSLILFFLIQMSLLKEKFSFYLIVKIRVSCHTFSFSFRFFFMVLFGGTISFLSSLLNCKLYEGRSLIYLLMYLLLICNIMHIHT
jgi:hypothetical protein